MLIGSKAVLFCNRLFPSCSKPLFQSEAKHEAIDIKLIFNYHANEIHFLNKDFALSLVSKVRRFGTQKWPIQWLVLKMNVDVSKTPPPPLEILSIAIFLARKRKFKINSMT